MTNRLALVADSAVQRAWFLKDRYGVTVVPLTIEVDGEAFLEDVDLTRDVFYEKMAAGCDVKTAAPAPGRFLEAYQAAADSGAESILSIHLHGDVSGTCNAARVAGEMSPVPVEVYDTRMAGWGIDACVEAAGTAIEEGADLRDAVAAVDAVRSKQMTVFVIGQPALFEKGGRSQLMGRSFDAASVVATVPSGGIMNVGKAQNVDGVVSVIADYVIQQTGGAAERLAIGDARSSTAADELASRLTSTCVAGEVIRFEFGASLATHLGPGTVAATVYPVT